jgi:hypothetical protein
MQDLIFTAWNEPGKERDTLAKIGLRGIDLKNMKDAGEQFHAIMKGILSKSDFNERVSLSRDIFGGKMGGKMMKLGNLDEVQKHAKHNIGESGDMVEANAENMVRAEKSIGRLADSVHVAYVSIFAGLTKAFGDDFIGGFIDKYLGQDKVEGYAKSISDAWNNSDMGKALSQGKIGEAIFDAFMALGDAFARGAMNAIADKYPILGGMKSGMSHASMIGTPMSGSFLDTIKNMWSGDAKSGEELRPIIEAIQGTTNAVQSIIKSGGQLVWGQ